MSDSVHVLYNHIIFGTKRRVPHLSLDISPPLYAYLGGIVKNHGCIPIIVGGHRDHIHMLVRMGKGILVEFLAKETKRASSIWLKEDEGASRKFAWQTGYAAFSISDWDVAKIRQYIANQEKHHRSYDWKEEMRRIFKRYGIAEEETSHGEWNLDPAPLTST